MDAFAKTDHAVIVVPGGWRQWEIRRFSRHGEGSDREINDAFVGSPTIRVTRMTEEDDVVVAEGTVQCARKDGGLLDAVFCDVFVMQEAKIKHLTSYLMELKA